MTLHKKLQNLFISYAQLWGLYILFFIVFGVLTIWYPELKNDSYQQTEINELLKNNPLKLFVLACIFAPIIEELMFRTLVKPTHSDVILFICSWPVFIGLRFLPVDIHWSIRTGFGFVVLFVLFYILKQGIPEAYTKRLRAFLSSYALTVLTLTSTIFGLVHINNYVDSFAINAALLMLIIPRVIAGFMMGWLKIKNGRIHWAMGLHFLNNAFVVLIGIAFR